jgi:hypothetical protein
VSVQGRTYEPVHAIGGGRLEAQLPTALVERRLHVLELSSLGQHGGAEPSGKTRGVAPAHLAEAEEATNLRAVVLDGAATPSVASPESGREVELRRDILDHRLGHFASLTREAALDLNELQEHSEAETGRPGLLADHLVLCEREGPLLGELIGVPVTFHGCSWMLLDGEGLREVVFRRRGKRRS